MASKNTGLEDNIEVSMLVTGKLLKTCPLLNCWMVSATWNVPRTNIAGLWGCLNMFGAGAGPVLLGILTDQWGFRVATSVTFVIAIAMLISVCIEWVLNRAAMSSKQTQNYSETKPLLGISN